MLDVSFNFLDCEYLCRERVIPLNPLSLPEASIIFWTVDADDHEVERDNERGSVWRGLFPLVRITVEKPINDRAV